MVTISFTKHQLFLMATALEMRSYEEKDDRLLQVEIIGILQKFRKNLRKRTDKAEILMIMDEVQTLIPEKKKPLKKVRK